MKIFGEKCTFAIEYEFEVQKSKDTRGYIRLWVKNNNICAYNQSQQCNVDLYYIVEWFCEKIEYILGYDAFPLPVNGNTSLDLLETANNFESNDILELDLWFDAKSRWRFNHCWFAARGGAVLPCVYFRRVDKFIEISWDNTFWEEQGIVFSSQNSYYQINFIEFTNTITNFLLSVIEDFAKRIRADKIENLKHQISILQY